jgi:hypothetical protein
MMLNGCVIVVRYVYWQSWHYDMDYNGRAVLCAFVVVGKYYCWMSWKELLI